MQQRLVPSRPPQKGGAARLPQAATRTARCRSTRARGALRKMDIAREDDDGGPHREPLDAARQRRALVRRACRARAAARRRRPCARIHKRIVDELEAQSNEGKSADVGVKLAAYDTRKRGDASVARRRLREVPKKLDLDLERRDIGRRCRVLRPARAAGVRRAHGRAVVQGERDRGREEGRAPARPRRAQGQGFKRVFERLDTRARRRGLGERVQQRDGPARADAHRVGGARARAQVRRRAGAGASRTRRSSSSRAGAPGGAAGAATTRAPLDEDRRCATARPDRVVAQEGASIRSVFEKMDADRSGAIEKDELRRARCASSRSTRTRTSAARPRVPRHRRRRPDIDVASEIPRRWSTTCPRATRSARSMRASSRRSSRMSARRASAT